MKFCEEINEKKMRGWYPLILQVPRQSLCFVWETPKSFQSNNLAEALCNNNE